MSMCESESCGVVVLVAVAGGGCRCASRKVVV